MIVLIRKISNAKCRIKHIVGELVQNRLEAFPPVRLLADTARLVFQIPKQPDQHDHTDCR